MQPERDDRYRSAVELARAVEGFLEGSKRRRAAKRHREQARKSWGSYQQVVANLRVLERREAALTDSLEPWLPLSEKQALLDVRDQLRRLARERVDRFEEVVSSCEQALSQDPGNPDARSFLAEVHFARLQEAEALGDEDALRHHEQRVKRYDDGRLAPQLRGTGRLSLQTDPPGAEVIRERYLQEGLIWPLVEQRELGMTPLLDVPLEMGSYRLLLRLPGRADTIYPLHLARGEEHDATDPPLRLLSEAQIGTGHRYVPAGPFLTGGDPEVKHSPPRAGAWVDGFVMAVRHVTMSEYRDFINELHHLDPDAAWLRVPRQGSALKVQGSQHWERPASGEPYVIPERDRDGDPWDPRWAACAISWDDCSAYAAWRAEQDGLPWRLPTELEWEKAARGADARLYPWGNRFDATLCKMRDSQSTRPLPVAVCSYPTDVSPYGIRDIAGGMRDWCGDLSFEGDDERRPVRGGSWYTSERVCRSTHRYGDVHWIDFANYGFRLARSV